MRVVIAGGTGFLGSALARSLRESGDEVISLTRRPRDAGQVAWDPADPAGAWTKVLEGSDAVVNLAGEPLDAGRWTAARKASILESRLRATKAITAAITRAEAPPRVLLSASAVGIYGPRGDEPVTEATPPADDFLAHVCRAWEAEALAASARSRVVLLRTGLALDRHDGALPRLAMPFQFGAGGPAGSGRQWWSWIHVDDWVSLVRWAIETPQTSGPVNLTAPQPVTNREFARTLGEVLHRPSLLPAPALALRLLLGEMADALILSGQRVVPAAATAGGFRFRYETLDAALRAIYSA